MFLLVGLFSVTASCSLLFLAVPFWCFLQLAQCFRLTVSVSKWVLRDKPEATKKLMGTFLNHSVKGFGQKVHQYSKYSVLKWKRWVSIEHLQINRNTNMRVNMSIFDSHSQRHYQPHWLYSNICDTLSALDGGNRSNPHDSDYKTLFQ